MDNALTLFYSVREIDGLKKKPSTSELIDWIKLLAADRSGRWGTPGSGS